MFRVLRALALLVIVTASMAVFSGRADAHERRMVGPYQLVVGFLTEPAFAGSTNGLDLRVTDTRNNPATPVEGLEKTLTATVSAGGVTPLAIEIKSRFGQPGAYAAYFVPTVAGQYVFNIAGKIGAQDVNEKFESGPGRFDDVGSSAAIQYPVKVPEGSDLASRLDAVHAGLDQTRIFAIVALVLAIGGVIGAAYLGRRAR